MMSTLFLALGIGCTVLGVVLLVLLTVLFQKQLDKSAKQHLTALMEEKKITPRGLKRLVREVAEEQLGRMTLPYFLCILGLVFVIVSLCL